MVEKRLGVGVVGIGWVSHPHIDAWLKTGRCDVVALCSHSEENARAAVAQHGLTSCRVYTDYAQMVQQQDIDIIDICSRNASHAEQGLAAAEAGKHVLVEKPVAMTLDELRRLDRAITTAGVKSLAGFVLHMRSSLPPSSQLWSGSRSVSRCHHDSDDATLTLLIERNKRWESAKAAQP